MNERSLQAIVAATDLSPRAGHALARAIRLAREHGARLTALTVVERAFSESPGSDSALRAIFRVSDGVEEEVLAGAERELRDEVARLARGKPLACDVRARLGSAFGEILNAARDTQADLIVLGAHGRHYLRGLLLGTTAARVARHGERSVLVVRKPASRPYRRVIVATDFSEHARRALRRARRLAPAAGIDLFHAYELWYEYRLRTGITSDEVQRLHLDYETQARERLAALAREAGLDPGVTPCVVRYGYAGNLVVKAAAERRADLVVVGTRGLTGLNYALLGSVAEHVLRESPCDVLVVPDSQETPRAS
ncbi:universal stress protein [Sulfurifustis variabilis]|uniref:Universal stress protein n=1 Tax=Sulfurifustis variabilis TaxID=1675686 RepID=A0A1B4VD44_9GAMM|nr:universal stress protein [Sulfurifustis variabilis]BAU50201.1 universal stress protein [Sulfurifustis variabilis]